jgi:hypothetical protein
MAFPEKIDEFRNRTILKINKNNLTAVRYEGEKSYSLNKNRNQWMLNDKPADSAKVEKYINKLVQVAGRNFADGFVGGNTPDKTITLSLTNQEPVIVKAFKTDSSYVVHSSQNKKAYFVADESIMQRIFQQADELQ